MGKAAGWRPFSRLAFFKSIQAVQLSRFKGESWDLFGDIMAAEST